MKIVIAYGTETFNSEGLAHETQDLLLENGFEADVLDLEDFAEETFDELDVFLVITSTFGDGEPPSNAEDAYEVLMSDDAPSMKGIRFSVCGLGDTAYEYFCQCGKDFDKRMSERVETALAARVDCDTDFEEPWSEWVDSVVVALKKGKRKSSSRRQRKRSEAPVAVEHSTVDDRPSVALERSSSDVLPSPAKAARSNAKAVGTRKNPYLTRVLGNRNLNHPFSEKETRHVVIALDGDVVPYKVGDSLGIFPRNCPNLVRRILLPQGYLVKPQFNSMDSGIH